MYSNQIFYLQQDKLRGHAYTHIHKQMAFHLMEISLDARRVGHWLHVLALHHVEEDGDGRTSQLCTPSNSVNLQGCVNTDHIL